MYSAANRMILPLLKRYGVCLFVCLSDGKVSDGKGIKNVLIPGAAVGCRWPAGSVYYLYYQYASGGLWPLWD